MSAPGATGGMLDDPRYVTKRMSSQIGKTCYVAKSGFAGWGQFARRRLNRGTVVGYFTGRVLNASTRDRVNPNWVASASWRHPVSGKTHWYFFEVMSPSRLMNGGIHPRYLRRPVRHPMKANVGLNSATVKVNGRHRLVLVLRTLCEVGVDHELLLDYGVWYDTLFFEFLRRNGLEPGRRSERRFERFIERQHRSWPCNGARSRWPLHDDAQFLEEFGRDYVNKEPLNAG